MRRTMSAPYASHIAIANATSPHTASASEMPLKPERNPALVDSTDAAGAGTDEVTAGFFTSLFVTDGAICAGFESIFSATGGRIAKRSGGAHAVTAGTS